MFSGRKTFFLQNFFQKNLQQRINESIFYDPFNLILVKEMKMRLLEKNNSGKISGTSSGCVVSFSVSVCFLSSSLTVSLVVPAAVVLLVLVGRV